MPSEPNGPFETDTSCEPKDCVIEEKTDYYGEDIKWEIKESQQACADWCVSTEGCCFWSWNKNKECFVKSSKGQKEKNSGAVSGNRGCGTKSSEEPTAPLEPNGPSESDTSCEPKECTESCDPNWVGHRDKCYKLSDNTGSWSSGVESCRCWIAKKFYSIHSVASECKVVTWLQFPPWGFMTFSLSG